MLYLLLSAMAWLMPAITEASVPTPLASKTFRLIMLASMATPPKPRLLLAIVAVTLSVPSAMPATCVPWPYSSLVSPPTKHHRRPDRAGQPGDRDHGLSLRRRRQSYADRGRHRRHNQPNLRCSGPRADHH